MIFNPISLVMSCVTQITAGCVIEKHLASQKVENVGAQHQLSLVSMEYILLCEVSDSLISTNIALGCTGCLNGPFNVQLLDILLEISCHFTF